MEVVYKIFEQCVRYDEKAEDAFYYDCVDVASFGGALNVKQNASLSAVPKDQRANLMNFIAQSISAKVRYYDVQSAFLGDFLLVTKTDEVIQTTTPTDLDTNLIIEKNLKRAASFVRTECYYAAEHLDPKICGAMKASNVVLENLSLLPKDRQEAVLEYFMEQLPRYLIVEYHSGVVFVKNRPC